MLRESYAGASSQQSRRVWSAAVAAAAAKLRFSPVVTGLTHRTCAVTSIWEPWSHGPSVESVQAMRALRWHVVKSRDHRATRGGRPLGSAYLC